MLDYEIVCSVVCCILLCFIISCIWKKKYSQLVVLVLLFVNL